MADRRGSATAFGAATARTHPLESLHTLDPRPGGLLQRGTVSALLAGGLEGPTRLGQLLKHGGLGLGTVVRIDGELVVLDGLAFAARADGRIDQLDPEDRTAYAVVCDFRPELSIELGGPARPR